MSSLIDSQSQNIEIAEVLFQPAPRHVELKSQFWNRYVAGPFDDKAKLSLAQVQEVMNVPALNQLWNVPGFKDWFLNTNEVAEKVDYLLITGLAAMEQILMDPKAQAGAKINAIKLLAEIKGLVARGGNGKQVAFSDEKINKMSESELKSWLSQRGVQVQTTHKVTPVPESDE